MAVLSAPLGGQEQQSSLAQVLLCGCHTKCPWSLGRRGAGLWGSVITGHCV